jgi:predicted transposase/invertase (TIGR01784 family)
MEPTQFLSLHNPVAFQKVFASEENKDILIHFLNDIIKFPSPIEKVTFLETSQSADMQPIEVPRVKISCEDQVGNSLLIILHVPYEKDFEHNLLCEASGAYCAQSKSETKLAVYSLAITNFLAFAEKKVWLSRMGIKDLDTHEHDITSIQFYFMQLPLFKKTQADTEGLSIREKWAYLFKYAEDTQEEETQLIVGKHTIIRRVYEVLNSNNWNEQEINTYNLIERKKVIDRSILEDIYEQGMQASKREIARYMLKEELEISLIKKATGLSYETIEKLKQK